MRLHRNRRALSPIFATLILIAIAVIAGIIVYMFTSGALAGILGGTGQPGTEKVAVETVVPAIGSASVWAKSTGGTDVVIDGALVKNSGGTTVQVVALATAAQVTLPADGTLTEVPITAASLTASEVFTITLTSKGGGAFVSSSFQVPAT